MKREKVGGGQPVHSRNSADLFQNLLKRRCIVCDARYRNRSHLVEAVKQSHGALYWYLSLEVDQRVQYKSGRSIGIPKRVVQTRSLDQIGNQFAGGLVPPRLAPPGGEPQILRMQPCLFQPSGLFVVGRFIYGRVRQRLLDRKSTRLNSSHLVNSY